MEKAKNNKKGVHFTQRLLESKPCGMWTPLSGWVGCTRLWMPPA